MIMKLCRSPLWVEGHISQCVQTKYLGTLAPLAVCLASIAILLFAYCCHLYRSSRKNGFQHLPVDEDDTTSAHQKPQTHHGYVTKLGSSITITEAILLVLDILVETTALHPTDHMPPGSAWLSFYLLLLLVVRQSLPSLKAAQHAAAVSVLQRHALVLYSLQWLLTLLPIHAAFKRYPKDDSSRMGLSVRLALFTILNLFHLCSPRMPKNSFGTEQPGKQDEASIISGWTFHWIQSLVWKAYRDKLEPDDLYELGHDHKADTVDVGFQATASGSHSLLRRLFGFFYGDLLRQGAWAALMSLTVFVPPALIRSILQYLQAPENGEISRDTAWMLIAGILVAGVVTTAAECQSEWVGRSVSAKLRSILVGEIYSKVLRQKGTTGSQSTSGSILNLMSTDAETVSEIASSIHLTWVVFPVQLTIATWLLYRILGVSGIIGVILMIVLLPLNVLLSRKQMSVREKVLTASDARISASSEVLQNMRTIKYSAWESSFQNRVLLQRGNEMRLMRTRFIWWSLSMTVFYSLPLFVTFFSCFFYTVVWKNSLGTATAFPALAIFAILRIPLDRMSDSITYLLQAYVSLQRINKFLQERETSKYVQRTNKVAPGTGNDFIGFENATLKWPQAVSKDSDDDESQSNSPRFALQNISIGFEQGKLNVICGPSGSGKSSLLLALLGEMEYINGHVFLPQAQDDQFTDSTAYCPQEAWIVNTTIRSNIILGMPFIPQRYDAVLSAVALHHDLAELDQKDETLAGENGNRLSGGQKQRVALARALYSQSRYVVLDDCLSALDHTTAKHVFFHAIKGPLMSERTCILATHNSQLAVPHCGHAVFLDHGRVKAAGSPEELISQGTIKPNVVAERTPVPPQPSWYSKIDNAAQSFRRLSMNASFDPKRKSDYAETMAEGTVSWSVMNTFLISMGSKAYWIVVLTGFAVQQVISLGTNLWIKRWAYEYDEAAKKTRSSGDEHQSVNAGYYLAIYLLICALYALASFLRDGITFYGSLRASSKLYQRMLSSVLHAKMLFFDQVPLGQLMNRFTKDVAIMDYYIAPFSVSALQIVVSICMVVVLISAILPEFLFVAAFIFVAYCAVMVVYLAASLHLKRVETVERSPLYQQLGESIDGCISIRAYSYQSTFTKQNNRLVDRLNQPYILQWATKEWLTLRVGVLSAVIQFATGAFVLLKTGTIEPGAAGLALVYAATFTENVLFLVQLYAMIQQNFNSVERIVEYTTVEQEPIDPPHTPDHPIPTSWPENSTLEFKKYSTKYAPHLDPVLKNISFEAQAGQRIAIVGRTGSGKSTLALSLIRILEADSGCITISGEDIASVTLERLRQNVTIVAQDPMLFGGTIRDNLDPLGEFTDEEINDTLAEFGAGANRSGEGDRSAGLALGSLDDDASAFSRGQKQLLCIARGLVRRSKLLVLDEATASIDHAADEQIQAGLRAAVNSGTTVVTIAHRLLTIADYDRVIVLDAGQIVEQGSVAELLQRSSEEGVFRKLCENSGDLENIKKAANRV